MTDDTAARTEFRLLGPLEIIVDDTPVALGPPKQRALLVALLMRTGETVPVEELVDELWPEDPPETARHAVQVYVSRLRRALGEPNRIVAHGRAYALRAQPDELDLHRFRALVNAGRKELDEEPAAAAKRLHEALALWRGRALADLGDETGLRDVVLELEEERLAAIELRIECDLAAGNATPLVGELERLLAEHPARETLYAHQMLALYRSGRQADALDVYRRAREALMRELGLEPSARLKELERAILRQDPALTVESPGLRARRHLPAQPNILIGRERELDELVDLVASGGVRLVTLTGPGGIGKTRLALAAAERLAGSFADGVWFVDLASLSESALVPSAIAQALGVAEQPGQPLPTTLAEHLREREVLLLADNFEHLLEGAATVSTLLKDAPGLKVLVTSRAPLDLYGEHTYEVPSLDVPDLDSALQPYLLERNESVSLFAERARAVRRTFTLTSGTARAVAEICVRLDGLPLAIELAALRLRSLSPAELLAGLSSRLETLTQAPRDVPDRHRTLRAAIEWGYDLLPRAEQQAFRRLSVFAGGCTPEAAEEVAGADLDVLRSLFENGLLRFTAERYWMLETIREFAAGELDRSRERPATDKRHAVHYMRLAEAAEPHLRKRDQAAWIQRLDAEHDNLRAALARSLQHDPTTAARIAAALWRFWYLRSHYREGRMWIEAVVASAAQLDPVVRARLLNGAGVIAFQQSDIEAAKQYQMESLDLARASGDRHGEEYALGDLSVIASASGEHEEGLELLQQALAIARELNDEWVIAVGTAELGTALLHQGNAVDAIGRLREAVALTRRIADTYVLGDTLHSLGVAYLHTDEIDAAALTFAEAVDSAAGSGDQVALAYALEGLAAAVTARGDLNAAVQLLSAAELIRTTVGVPPIETEAKLVEPYLVAARRALPARGRTATTARSESAAIDEAIATTKRLVAALR